MSRSEVAVTLKDGEEHGLVLEGTNVKDVKDGPFKGKLRPGDNIAAVNGEPTTGSNIVVLLGKSRDLKLQTGDVEQKSTAQKTTNDATVEESAATIGGIPADREKFVQRREGFTYHYIQVEYKRGLKFGLGIKHYQNKVIVSKIDAGSLSALHLMVMDHIVDINGQPVSDKDVCRDLLIKALQKNRKADMVIERPESEAAKEIMKQALHASQLQPPSVAMGSDIRDIVAKQQQRMKKGQNPSNMGILRVNNAPKGRVQMDTKQKEVIIASDNEGKELKKVKQ